MRSNRFGRRAWLWLPLCALLTGCAKTGDPAPPRVRVPKPAVDLSARQIGDTVVLAVSRPVVNTNGSPLEDLASIELLRVTVRRGDRPGPLAEDAFLARAVETSMLTAEAAGRQPLDKVLVFSDGLSSEGPPRFSELAYCYGIRFINRKNQTAGLSNQACVAPLPLPAAPAGLTYDLSSERLRLFWSPPDRNSDGSAPPTIIGYRIYRSEDPKRLPGQLLNSRPLAAAEFEDRNFQFDRTYYYSVSVVGSEQNPDAESAPSDALSVTPKDTFPPAAPPRLDVVVEKGVVILFWTPPSDVDTAGYRVYRRQVESERRELLTPEPVLNFSFRDAEAPAGRTCEYAVTSIDTHGNEGPPAVITVQVPAGGAQ